MNRLSVRLSLAFLLVAWLAVGALAFAVQRTVDAGFRSYVGQRDASLLGTEQVSRLEAYYAAHGSWDGVDLDTLRPGAQRGRGASQVVVGLDGRVVAATDAALVGESVAEEVYRYAVPLVVDGETIGWVYRQSPGVEQLGAAETLFLDTANRTLGLMAVAVSVVAVTVGVGLAWLLVRPLNHLATAVRRITRGHFGAQVVPSGPVETVTLANAFNGLSRQLADAEDARRRMAADVAHELRTPVSVLRGQLEAMRDGVFPADQMHLAVAHDQTLHLGRLVDDLRLLTLAEAGEISLTRQPVDIGALVESAVARFLPLAQDADVLLRAHVAAGLPTLQLDSARIRQVLDNLLANAVRHTPPGGEIVLSAERAAQTVVVSVVNSGALPVGAAEHMLDRFWRADEARQRDSGGSGLGLPIARQLVALHGGQLWVDALPTQTALRFSLPLASGRPTDP